MFIALKNLLAKIPQHQWTVLKLNYSILSTIWSILKCVRVLSMWTWMLALLLAGVKSRKKNRLKTASNFMLVNASEQTAASLYTTYCSNIFNCNYEIVVNDNCSHKIKTKLKNKNVDCFFFSFYVCFIFRLNHIS